MTEQETPVSSTQIHKNGQSVVKLTTRAPSEANTPAKSWESTRARPPTPQRPAREMCRAQQIPAGLLLEEPATPGGREGASPPF